MSLNVYSKFGFLKDWDILLQEPFQHIAHSSLNLTSDGGWALRETFSIDSIPTSAELHCDVEETVH